VQVRPDAVAVAGPLLLNSVNTRHQVTRCGMPCVVVLDVVGSNRSLASPAPVAAYSSEIQQPIRAAATLGRRQHPYLAAPLDRDQDRAGSLHPGGLAAFWPHEDAQRRRLLRTSE
jgi:hypothetical protein